MRGARKTYHVCCPKDGTFLAMLRLSTPTAHSRMCATIGSMYDRSNNVRGPVYSMDYYYTLGVVEHHTEGGR
jgi:hypothetical protein